MKIRCRLEGSAPPEVMASNRAHAHALGLPMPLSHPRGQLAVIGGGPSVVRHVAELMAWPGDRWIIGTAWPWAREMGIAGTFFCCDAKPLFADLARGAETALLASCVAPELLDRLLSDHARIEIFDLFSGEEGSNHGVTTATAAPSLALEMGYESVHFFGCDSSFEAATHAYMDRPSPAHMKVDCGGRLFDTDYGMTLQAEVLAGLMREIPDRLICRSDGLIAAMIDCQDYDVVAVRRDFYAIMSLPDGRMLSEVRPPLLYTEPVTKQEEIA